MEGVVHGHNLAVSTLTRQNRTKSESSRSQHSPSMYCDRSEVSLPICNQIKLEGWPRRVGHDTVPRDLKKDYDVDRSTAGFGETTGT